MLANGPKCPGHRTIPRVTPETQNYSLRRDTMVGREKIVSVFPLLYYIFVCVCVFGRRGGGGGGVREREREIIIKVFKDDLDRLRYLRFNERPPSILNN